MKKMMAIALMIVLLGAAYAVAQNQEEKAEVIEITEAIEVTEVTEEEAEEENQECIVCRVVAETEEDGEETESFVPVEDETLAQKLTALGYEIPDSQIVQVGAAIGSHIGPNACGIVYVAE